jgi:hypothetical protein
MKESYTSNQESESSPAKQIGDLIKLWHPDRHMSETENTYAALTKFTNILVNIREFSREYGIGNLNSWKDIGIEVDTLEVAIPSLNNENTVIKTEMFLSPKDLLEKLNILSSTQTEKEIALRNLRHSRMPQQPPEQEQPKPTSPFAKQTKNN